MTEKESAFDVAVESNERINRMLADTGGTIATMSFAGTIGYHINVARGESHPEYLWKVALLQALDEALFDMMHVDEAHPADAREQVEQQLSDALSPMTVEHLGEEFEENLTHLIDVQESTESGGGLPDE